MSQQNPLTLVTKIIPEQVPVLREYLCNMKNELKAGDHELFEKTNNIHYLRWLIIDDPSDIFFKKDPPNPHPDPKLVFSSNFDGDVKSHIQDLCNIATKEIDKIYECCIGYPDEKDRNSVSRIEFLDESKVKASSFYIGARGRTVIQIKRENKLRNHLKCLINKKNWKGKTPAEIHQKLKEEIPPKDDYEWLKESYTMPRINWFNMILLGLVIIILLPIIIVWILIVQYGYERNDDYFTKDLSSLSEEKTKKLEKYEDLGKEGSPMAEIEDRNKDEDCSQSHRTTNEQMFYQNQFSQLVEMKKGKVRLITFNAMMLFSRVLIPNLFVKGELMNIPTIHFARWVLFDENKRVLFFSNFDGSWQQYLGDFIDQSGWGLTGIFSNTGPFPKTRFLFTGGAYDEGHFLAWSRNSQIPTQIWYSAYPELSIKNINNNSQIRVLFTKNLSNKGAEKFFELI